MVVIEIVGKIKRTHQPFEGDPSGNFIKITFKMIDSDAWEALTRSQRSLYLQLKRKYTAKISNGKLIADNSRDISFTVTEAKKFYGELRTFRKDVDRLIECGFIDCVRGGHTTRTASIYGFSDRWKKFGKSDFRLPTEFLRPLVALENNKSKTIEPE